jgi:hypothetical protein
MGTEIKLYKELVYIETFDGEIYTVAQTLQEVAKMVENETKFLNIGTTILNKSGIKRIYKETLDPIDQRIILIPNKDVRIKVRNEIKERRENGLRVNEIVLDNIIKKYLKD